MIKNNTYKKYMYKAKCYGCGSPLNMSAPLDKPNKLENINLDDIETRRFCGRCGKKIIIGFICIKT